MFPLGHLGIGTALIPARIRDRWSWAWFAFGCLLPDVLDKPVFLAAGVASRALPDEFDVLLDALHNSRLLGHSLFFFAALVGAAALTRSERLRAIAWGVSTHLVLDLFPDLLSGERVQWPTWLLWPVFGWHFPSHSAGGAVQGMNFERAIYRAGELVGAAMLALEYARRRRARA